MKTIKIFITLIVMLAGVNAPAQQTTAIKPSNPVTVSIKVSGNCESCKARIEKAAKIKGVQKATWNIDSGKLALIFDPSVVSSDDVQEKIASVGHDTEKYRADDKTYNSLPSCCRYDRSK